MTEVALPHACKPVEQEGKYGRYWVVHVEDHVFNLHASDASDKQIETFAASLAARYRLAEHLASIKGK